MAVWGKKTAAQWKKWVLRGLSGCVVGVLLAQSFMLRPQASEEKEVYRVAAYGELYPMFYRTEDGEMAGVVPEMIGMLEDQLNWEFELVMCESSEEKNALAEEKSFDYFVEGYDCFDFVYGAKRSDTILPMPMSVVVRGDNRNAASPVLAVIRGMELELIDDAKIVEYDDFEQCVKAVADGEADYTYGCSWVLEALLKDPVYHDLMTISSGFGKLRLAALSKRANLRLPMVNEAALNLNRGQLNQMVTNTLLSYEYQMTAAGFLYTNAAWIVTGVLLTAFVVILFIRQRAGYQVKMQKEIAKRTLLEETRYRVAAEISNDILFEYDIVQDRMTMGPRFEEVYGRECLIPDFIKDKNEMAYVHHEDISVCNRFLDELASGKERMEAEFRMQGPKGEYIWGHLRGKTITDDSGAPLRVIGKIVNMDMQKKELERLQYKAQRDPFTGVYNKEVFAEKVETCLTDDGKAGRKSGRYSERVSPRYALLIVDIDNFKRFNDRYGHLYGDQVLKQMVDIMRVSFERTDLLGRIGGDEFAAFLKVSSLEETRADLDRLMDRIHCIGRHTEEGKRITVSIGVALTAGETDYRTLFREADDALYRVKNQGKDSYTIESASLEKEREDVS